MRISEKKIIMTDEQLVELYCQRSADAISETDKKYGHFLFCIALNILHDAQDSEECQNDTYLGVWNAIPPTKPDVFSAFIAKIVRRIAVNRYKERTRKKRIPSEMTISIEDMENTLHSDNSVEYAYDAKELGKTISDYVRTLNERQRFIFIDRYYLAESVEYIAKELSVSVQTVYREIDKIKRGLKQHLERNEFFV